MRIEHFNRFTFARLYCNVALARDTVSVKHVLAAILTGRPQPDQGKEGGAWEGVDEGVDGAE